MRRKVGDWRSSGERCSPHALQLTSGRPAEGGGFGGRQLPGIATPSHEAPQHLSPYCPGHREKDKEPWLVSSSAALTMLVRKGERPPPSFLPGSCS